MARPLEDGGDSELAEKRAKARLNREIHEARRSKVKADIAEGKVIELADARQQVLSLCSGVRRALDLAPSYLPSSLLPHEREACAVALRGAIGQALIHVHKTETELNQ
jgi:hypothetical protein